MSNLIGQTLLKQFRVEAFIAAGGMGTVYRVWDLKRSVPLAMKVLHADLAEDPSILKRFKREARALEKLAHPNIVPFYGLYQTQDFAFLVERYIDGPTLKQVLRRREGRPLSADEALVYLKALSSALGYAHSNGVVHCDVKPGNVMIDKGGGVSDGCVRLGGDVV
jgi:serine/threonine-protein kinase